MNLNWNVDMEAMEYRARNALDAGIGLYHTVRCRIEELEQDMQSAFTSARDIFEDLVTQGAAEQSGTAVRLRGLLDEGIDYLSHASRAGRRTGYDSITEPLRRREDWPGALE